MKRIALIQIGFGTVGGAVIEQVLENQERWRRQLGLDVVFVAVAGRDGAYAVESGDALGADALRSAVARRRARARAEPGGGAPSHSHRFEPIASVVERFAGHGDTIVLDAAAGDETATVVADALARGAGAVLSNKAPLSLAWDDPRSRIIWAEAGSLGRLRYEASCGAGLPVISTLRSLLDSGDDILEITGALSGTFGAIFSSVGSGTPFATAVRQAKEQGYTEPDPRDDLSGLDVARKGLILARTMGKEVDLDAIGIHSLVPEHLATVPVGDFLARLGDMNLEIGQRSREAVAMDASLKYVMTWKKGGRISVGLRQIPRSTVLGALQGPENIVSFRTARYDRYPCVISGPGAGAAVTAAGMVSDMLSIARSLPA